MKTYKYKINGQSYEVNITEVRETGAIVEVNGVRYQVDNETTEKVAAKPVVRPPRPASSSSTPAPSASPRKTQGATPGAITSPLPGLIVGIKVKEGDVVKKGDTVIILEAMKMENQIESDRDGVVEKILIHQGDTVMEGDSLITIGG